MSYIASTNIYMSYVRDYNNAVTPRTRSYPKFCKESPQRLRGVTPKMEGWPLNSFSKNNSFPEINQPRVLTVQVHEGHMGHYHH